MSSAISHPRIDDEQIVDRYLAGRLDADDEASFEEHLFACDACLAEVEAGEQLRRGLQAVAAADAARVRDVATLGLLAWLSRRPGRLAGAVLVALLVPALAVWQQVELRQTRALVDSLQHRPGLAVPTAAVQLVSLGVVRDAGPAVLEIDSSSALVLLSLELPAVSSASASSAGRYRVSLFGADNQFGADGVEPLWRAEGLEPTLYGSLLVALPASFLEPGPYRLAVDAGDGGAATIVDLRVASAPDQSR